MANVCDKCGKTVYRIKFRGDQWIGEDCGCIREIALRTCFNPFSDLTLDHISTEDGAKLRVTSLRQLQAAESRYNFASVVANMDAANVDTPPQQKRMEVADLYKWKFDRRQADAHKR